MKSKSSTQANDFRRGRRAEYSARRLGEAAMPTTCHVSQVDIGLDRFRRRRAFSNR